MEKRPWGNYKVLIEEKSYKVKRIEVNKGQRLSLQKHKFRSEQWVIVQGDGWVQLGNTSYKVCTGDQCFIPKEVKHRITNIGKVPLIFIEVQLGNHLDEWDIERYEDDYGRIEKK